MTLKEKEEYRKRLLSLKEMFDCIDSSWISPDDYELNKAAQALLGVLLINPSYSNDMKIKISLSAIKQLITLELM